MRPLILVGGGGHCRSSIDVIERAGEFKIVGIVDQVQKAAQDCFGIPYIGSDADLAKLKSQARYAMVTVGQIKSPDVRIRLFDQLKKLGFTLPTIVSPLAHVSSHAKLGEGTLVMHYAVVNAGATVGNNCIINTRSLLEHDVKVADHCHISTGAILNGEASVAEGSFIGSGSVVRERIIIGKRCVVAMGSNVFKNIADGSTFYVK